MSRYSGPATLVFPDGARAEGTASVWVQEPQSGAQLSGWSGTFRADHDLSAVDFLSALGVNLRIELPGGRAGEVRIGKPASPDRVLHLNGSGPAPF